MCVCVCVCVCVPVCVPLENSSTTAPMTFDIVPKNLSGRKPIKNRHDPMKVVEMAQCVS